MAELDYHMWHNYGWTILPYVTKLCMKYRTGYMMKYQTKTLGTSDT